VKDKRHILLPGQKALPGLESAEDKQKAHINTNDK